VSSLHSPLPPGPVPTIETISARLDHCITVIEVMASRVESMDDRWDTRVSELTKRERALSSLATRLGTTGLRLSAASLMPKGRWVVATSLGAFVGGIFGAMIWQLLHAASALAGP